MNYQTRNYLGTVMLLGCSLFVLQDWSPLVALPDEHLIGVISLIALAVFSEMLSVMYTVGHQQATSSIAFLPFFACVLLFPLPIALLVAAVTSLSSQLFVLKRPIIRAGFNAAQAALSLWMAAGVFEFLGGEPSLQPQDMLSASGFAAFAALAGTFFFANQAFVSVALAFSSGERVSVVFTRVMGPSGANLLYDVLVSPIALVVALLYSYLNVAGLVVVILPLLIIRHSYVSNMKLQQANKDLLKVLVKTIETRDPYTSGHSIRVSILARAIAEDMDLSSAWIDKIETAAIVHDIGKVDAVYASLIQKEGPLTDAERIVIVTHAAKGAEFLKTLTSFSTDVIEGVRHHHERFDGSGYPDGISGERIPLPARIIQLCDSIDAMLSDRPYRKALTVEHVRGELLRCGGTQFDPTIVDVILKRNTLERAAALVRPEGNAQRSLKVVRA
jgi:putative nucleotidyltransferase with HDIG domain